MKKVISLFLAVLLVSQSLWAQALTRREGDYAQFPILQCPATNEVMKDFRNKIIELKQSIKNEAACAPIAANVESLGKLVTDGRDTFLKLTSKGQTQGLNPADLLSVEKYVEELTTTTNTLFNVLTGNDACFAEDKQGTSMAFITSLIGESAKILSLVGGPMGGTVSLAANVITGFLKGMDQIKKNRRGYKFEIIEQRMAYANSLCSFFEYRRELDNILNPYESVANLQNLADILDRQLAILYGDCAECGAMVDLVNDEMMKGKNTPELLWTTSFDRLLLSRAESVDQLYTRNLGTHTYRALKTRTWIPYRITALQNSRLQADLGVQDVLNQMKDIEQFLVNNQARYFLGHLKWEASRWKRDLNQQVIQGRELLAQLQEPLVPFEGYNNYNDAYYNFYGFHSEMDAYNNSDKYYKYSAAVLESLENASKKQGLNVAAKVNSYLKKLDDVVRGYKVSVDLANNYCTFFGLAHWYGPEITWECESQDFLTMQKDVAMFTSFSSSASTRQMASPLPAQIPSVEAPAAADLNKAQDTRDAELAAGRPVQATTQDAAVENIASDWVQSLTQSVQNMTDDPNYVSRESGADPLFQIPLFQQR